MNRPRTRHSSFCEHRRLAAGFATVFAAVFAVTVLAATLAGPAAGQIRETDLWFDVFTERDGLSELTVNALVQDDLGFIWIGTDDGLLRYDGYEFTTFTHDPQDPNSLFDTTIYEIAPDGKGGLWIGTFSGIEHYDGTTGGFTRYVRGVDSTRGVPSDEYYEVHLDSNGYVWAGSNRYGLYRLDPSDGTVRAYRADADDPRALLSDDIDELFQAADLWVATGRYGLHRYDPETDDFERVFVTEPGEFAYDGFTEIVEGPDGAIWLGGWGIYRLDATGQVSRFLPYPDVSSPGTGRLENYINALSWDGDRLWAGSFGGGLLVFDPESQTFAAYGHDERDATSMPSNNVHEMLMDDRWNLWIGTEDGLARVTQNRRAISRITAPGVRDMGSVFGDPTGRLWLMFEGTIARYDPASSRVITASVSGVNPFASRFNFLKTFASEPQWLWQGVNDGSIRKLDSDGMLVDVLRVADVPDDMYVGIMDALELRDQPGQVWATAYDVGVCRLDLRTLEHTCHGDIQGTRALVEDPLEPGILWVGSNYTGLYRFDTSTLAVTDHMTRVEGDTTSLSIPFIQSLHASRTEPGVLWVGTWTGGLERFDTRTRRVTRHYTTGNSSLPDNTIMEFVEHPDGGLWMRTRRGLVRLDPTTGTISDFSNIIGFSGQPTGMTLLGDREIVFASGDAAYRFDPANLISDVDPPRVVVTEMRIRDTPVPVSSDGPLTAPVSRTESVTLPYADRDVSFDFVAFDFDDPTGIEYTYRLEGYDEDWHTADEVRRATYTNLPPGSYTFNVRAATADGALNEEGASVRLTIRPPWWRSVWAYMVYGLLFVAAVAAVDRVQRARVLRRERERSRERELEQAREIERAYNELRVAKDRLVQQEKLASLGHLAAGIAHEIKNPLNFINNFAEINGSLARELREAHDANPDATLSELLDVVVDIEKNAAVIKQHGERADGIVRSMMDHASGATGQRQEVEINPLVAEQIELAYHGKRGSLPGLSVEIERNFDPSAGSLELVPQEIGRVLLNLLVNAFDAVRARSEAEAGAEAEAAAAAGYNPRVSVTTRRRNGRVEISVADNGPGITPEARARLFEPFFTTKPTGAGTGLGLSMSHDIVTKGYGGELTVDGEPGEGATFTVSLPAG